MSSNILTKMSTTIVGSNLYQYFQTDHILIYLILTCEAEDMRFKHYTNTFCCTKLMTETTFIINGGPRVYCNLSFDLTQTCLIR